MTHTAPTSGTRSFGLAMLEKALRQSGVLISDGDAFKVVCALEDMDCHVARTPPIPEQIQLPFEAEPRVTYQRRVIGNDIRSYISGPFPDGTLGGM